MKARTAVAWKLTLIQAETFHEKGWHKADMSVHGTSGPLHTEPHDLAPISERVRESLDDYVHLSLPVYLNPYYFYII